MIAGLCVILICQLAGEVIVRGLGVPVPGPVLGLLFMLLLLLLRDRFPSLAFGPLKDDAIVGVARGLLANLSLLFIPAGVGIIQLINVLLEHGWAIVFALAVSVIATLFITAGTFLIVSKLMKRRDAGGAS